MLRLYFGSKYTQNVILLLNMFGDIFEQEKKLFRLRLAYAHILQFKDWIFESSFWSKKFLDPKYTTKVNFLVASKVMFMAIFGFKIKQNHILH